MKNEETQLFSFFETQGTKLKFEAKTPLFHQGDAISYLYWISSGKAQLVRRLADGKELSLQTVKQGMLAEASVFNKHYHCDGEVLENTSVLKVERASFEAALKESADFSLTFARYLAYNLRQSRTLLEIRSLKKLSDRLDAWIILNGTESLKHGSLHLVASELWVSKEALYREMSKRRK